MKTKRGRPKKPRDIKERQGTLNVTREKESTHNPYGEVLVNPETPTYFSAEEKKEYEYYLARVNPLGILKEEDLILLEMLATTIVLYKRTRTDLFSAKGSYVKSYRGGIKNHPAVRNFNMYARQIADLSSRLCIGPTVRATLKLGDPLGGHNPDDDAEFNDV